jgi:hypothetical protein
MLPNVSREELTLPKATVLGIAEEISEEIVDGINKEKPVNTKTSAKTAAKNQDLYRKLLAGKLDHLNLREKQLIEPVLQKYAHVFHDEDTNVLKPRT